MQRLKIALSAELRNELNAASARSGKSVAEEIRDRVAQSFALESGVDQPSRDFLEIVAAMPTEIELEMGKRWHTDAGAHFVFGEAILNRLERFKPKGAIAMPADADRPHATVTPTGKDAKSLLEQLARYIEFQLHRYGAGFSKSEMRQGLVEGRRRMMAAGFTADRMMGSPRVLLDTPNEPKSPKPDQQRKRGEKS